MRVLKALLSCSLLLLMSSSCIHAQEGSPLSTPMDTLRASHPRLLVLDSDLPDIKARIAADPFAKSEYNSLHAQAESLISKQPDVYGLNGPEVSLLWTSREMEGRIFTLSGMYRLTGERRFADRAIAEMLSATKFPNWNPNHFLDTAEMTAALGIGYDWIYPVLTPDQRATIKQAVIEKGINTFIDRLNQNKIHYRNNWAQVVYGGETIGSLAIAEPGDSTSIERAQKIIGYSRPGIGLVMRLFAPDGGFEEGPVYWNYATIYNVLYIAALDSALGTDFDAAKATGFDVTPRYEIQADGPLYEYANFGDAHSEASRSPQMYWFANRFHHPEYSLHERALVLNLEGKMKQGAVRESSRFEMMGLLWYASAPEPKTASPLPLVQSFSRVAQAYMRSSWSDSKAWDVGFKGGDAKASHGHLDLGSFVLDGFGKRWAIDLGPDSYGLPGYFGKQRWSYYRMKTEAHNTITVDGVNQDLDSVSEMLFARHNGKDEFAVADLDKAYKGKLQSWRRGMAILAGRRVLVQDEVSPIKSVDLVWHFHTSATINIATGGRSATLKLGGITMQAAIVAPADGCFSIATATLTSVETPNAGITDLVINQSHVSTKQLIAVLFSAKGDNKAIHLHDLMDWEKN